MSFAIILFVRKCFSQECLWPQSEAAVSGEPVEVNAYRWIQCNQGRSRGSSGMLRSTFHFPKRATFNFVDFQVGIFSKLVILTLELPSYKSQTSGCHFRHDWPWRPSTSSQLEPRWYQRARAVCLGPGRRHCHWPRAAGVVSQGAHAWWFWWSQVEMFFCGVDDFLVFGTGETYCIYELMTRDDRYV